MNRIDRQNLSALTNSVSNDSPIGLNTATGAPDLGEIGARPAATVADDMTVPNGGTIIDPKPGSKFALPDEDFGTVPVGMNNHGDYTGPATPSRPGASDRPSPGGGSQIIEPKPGSKFALPDEDFGTVPIGMNNHGDYTGPAAPSRTGASSRPAPSGGSQIIEPKPGSKFALPDEDFGTVPIGMNNHGDYTGPAAPSRTGASSRPAPSGGSQIIEPKPGSKFAAPDEDEDEFGAVPVPMVPVSCGVPAPVEPAPAAEPPRRAAHPAASVADDATMPNGGVITPKPGSKFAA